MKMTIGITLNAKMKGEKSMPDFARTCPPMAGFESQPKTNSAPLSEKAMAPVMPSENDFRALAPVFQEMTSHPRANWRTTPQPIVAQRMRFLSWESAKQARRMTASPMKPVKRSKQAS